ncbi:MAG TPA: SRPBCC domain-containing protein [Xanthobacteraceae bacterium]|nr:SRPBCC domain-containing protein [Xanthobacteraceae bacterium]
MAFRHPRPDGRDYKNKIIFTEVVKPERLVYRHAGEDEHEDVRFHVTVTFQTQGRKTLLTMRSLFATAQERDEVVTKYGAIEGASRRWNAWPRMWEKN